MTKTKAIFILTIVTLLFWLWQARVPLWNQHLQVDVWVWWERVNYYLVHHSFAGLEGNEILPATLGYIFIPLAMIPYGWLSYGNYLPAALIVNLAVMAGYLYLVKKNFPQNQPVLLIALLALGPILLFRFDAAVMLLIVGSFLAFTKKRFSLSGFLLGLATAMKVFPILFLPYLFFLKRSPKLLIFLAEALIIPVVIFFLLGGNWEQVVTALDFHSLKLISIESLPGTVITGWSLLTRGLPPTLIPGYGIWAVAGPAALFNRLWLVPIGLLYYLVWKNRPRSFSWNIPLSLMLVFLIFSKNLNPQYVWWWLGLLPFMPLSPWIWGLAVAAALLNQLVYPIFYTQLTVDFYQQNRIWWPYYLLLFRNLAIAILTYLILKISYWPSPKTKGKLARK